ncbi:uncharacterized protein LOC127573564 isoform X2 [Pristis pectinata]|uniref:uncharacterized protein LOC127573564 isoform X2 n=1 Tax=Pristis pectinata TaxID=685728 RepID=UPI00223D04AB|nr:uncharacterized protein LOC127573564 isoform X2 [Pristis pectinata]
MNLSGTWWQQKDMDDWVWVVAVPPLKLGSDTVRSLPPIFSAEDLEEVQKKKEDLEYQMNTVKERAKLELNWKIDYHLPGYRELSASRQDADSLLMKTTAGVGPKESELPLSPVKRSHFVSQAPKCQPGSQVKDSKCLPLKAQEKKQSNVQQILHWKNDRGQDKTVEPQGLLVHSHTPETVSCPAQTSNPVSVMQPPPVTALSELAEFIVE